MFSKQIEQQKVVGLRLMLNNIYVIHAIYMLVVYR